MPKIDFKPKLLIFPTLNELSILLNWNVDWHQVLDITDVDFELQIDYNDKFNSEFLTVVNHGFLRGNLCGAYTFTFNKKPIEKENFYFRVRLVNTDPLYYSEWSDVTKFEFKEDTDYEKA
ncbi:MAG: hypothetical protein ACTSQY_11325, partial [Candidatus Odinarchaeia archaeon]